MEVYIYDLHFHLWSINSEKGATAIQWSEDSPPRKWCRDYCIDAQKDELKSLSHIFHRYLFKTGHRQSKAKAIQSLEENIGKNLQHLILGKKFLDVSPKPQCIKGKNDKLDFIKLKTCFFLKIP